METLREKYARSTRRAILKGARKTFTRKGYAGASIDEIAAAARVTSGALYHHFRNKRAIMRAVFEMLEGELRDRVTAAVAGASSATQALRRSLRAFFDACLEDDIRAIVFEQAPRVLGSEEWRRIDAEFGLGLVLNLLKAFRTEGRVVNYRDEIVASLFLAAVAEAALQVAANQENRHLRAQCEQILEAFLRGLRPGDSVREN